MRLYHGSVVEVRKPSLRYGRKKTDFGRGFYTTTQAEQAENWTKIKQDRTKAPKRIVSVYEIDDAVLSNPELKIREFHGVDKAWLDFVVDSRKGIKHDYDLDAPAAIAQLKAYKTYDQLSFHTKKVIGALRFVESFEV